MKKSLPPIPQNLRDIRRPLMDISTAALLLDVMEADVEHFIADKAFVVFNIALPASGRSYLRLMTQSVLEPEKPLVKEDSTRLAGIILPASHITFSGVEIARLLHCSPTHVANLIKAGCLAEIGRHSPVNESPKIAKASLARFLISRRVP